MMVLPFLSSTCTCVREKGSLEPLGEWGVSRVPSMPAQSGRELARSHPPRRPRRPFPPRVAQVRCLNRARSR
eukprot:scaffold11460_cov64-Phaeocystis_antarctica.AAC.12